MEKLASIQLELETGYESLAEKRIKDAFQEQALNDYAAVGDLLNRAGDEKFVAFGNYQKASIQDLNWLPKYLAILESSSCGG